ncbi:LysR family transcriptional regulator [Micromonospora sp. KC606]|uniref:LysR family transcriptional regulator n=1 Tax=Micromonospora sp. KC606 TaxID=2530379 RepID=UPI0010532DCE|nr:LysR family transcriptional regulator [Micromonospora sp. KC606]TDC84985.1 LysR family transcriptional regulator [Micromonospora sp. KC606]
MLELSLLRALHAVSTGGSINAAAEALHITNSAVSQRLAKLERDVGQVLLERYGRGVRLTEAAKLLVNHAERILSLVDVAMTALEDHRGAVTGKMSIAAFPTAARGLLSSTMSRLRSEFPQLRIVLHEQDPIDSIPRVVRGDVDIAVVQDSFNAPLSLTGDLERASLMDDVIDLALPVDHPFADRVTVDMAEVARDTWVSWPRGTVCGDWLRLTLREYGVDACIEHAVAEYATQLSLVAAGFGIALIPRLGRDPVPPGVRLVRITPTLARHVYVVWRAETSSRPAIRATVDALVATAAELGDSAPDESVTPAPAVEVREHAVHPRRRRAPLAQPASAVSSATCPAVSSSDAAATFSSR